MNSVGAIDIRSFEMQLAMDAATVKQIDTILPIETASKPNGMFASDCCGSNNYDQQPY
jgi:hypothetical protein